MWQPKMESFQVPNANVDTSEDEMNHRKALELELDKLSRLAPKGYSVGLHIRYASPLFYRKTYDAEWQKVYDDNAYALRDPTVFWGLGVKGATRWSAIRLPDPFSIMEKARQYGLLYGAVISWGPITSRSIVGISRDDREFSDAEIEEAVEIVKRLHDLAEPPTELTEAQAEALRLLSDGYRHAAAAAELGISESALKARLKSARTRLGARTTAEAIRKAREYRFL